MSTNTSCPLKVVRGSFHQGNERFGESAGKQCTCCSLFSIAFTKVKSLGYLDSNDIDFVVENGDQIYKELNKRTFIDIRASKQNISF